jgi:hypothetical protein
MADIRIGEISTEVTVTDTDALLRPEVLARIVAGVEQAMGEKARAADQRIWETRMGGTA